MARTGAGVQIVSAFSGRKILDDLCANQLQPLLLKTLLNRAEGALLINAVGVDDVKQADEMVKLATAVAHLIGRSNFDAMSGQYYARFVVKMSITQTAICASRTA